MIYLLFDWDKKPELIKMDYELPSRKDCPRDIVADCFKSVLGFNNHDGGYENDY